MSFAAPETIVSVNESKVCNKCRKKVSKTRAESWNISMCPTCYHRANYMKKDEVDNNNYNSNPLETVATLARNAPFTLYLDLYTMSEMENIK